MIDAYTIGIRLALEDGVSAGIAAIRQDLAILDRAIASTAAGLVALRRLGQQASIITHGDAEPAPAPLNPAQTTVAPASPRASVAGPNPSNPPADALDAQPSPDRKAPDAPIVPLDRPRNHVAPITQPSVTASPPVAPLPMRDPTIAVPESRPRSAQEFAPAVPGAARPFPASQQTAHTRPDAAPSPSVAPRAPVTESPVASTAEGKPAAGHPDDSWRHSFSRQVPEPRAWSDYAASTSAVSETTRPPRPGVDYAAPPHNRPDLAIRKSGAFPTGAAPTSVASHAAPRLTATDWGNRRALGGGGPNVEAGPRIPPHTGTEEPSARVSGDIVLEGSRLGRWMADRLARMTERPPSGSTGIDPRSTPGWPGLYGD